MDHHIKACYILLYFFFNVVPSLCSTTPCTPPSNTTKTNPITIQLFPTYAHTIHNNYGQKSVCPSKETKWYKIKTKASALVVDGSEPSAVKVREYTGGPQQLWKFEPADKPGVYYIVNNHTGSVLDYVTDSLVVALKEKNSSVNQQWILNSNGRIFNVGSEYNIDVTDAKYVSGTLLHVWKDNGNQAQQFEIHQVA